jgi:hypothetical protein
VDALLDRGSDDEPKCSEMLEPSPSDVWAVSPNATRARFVSRERCGYLSRFEDLLADLVFELRETSDATDEVPDPDHNAPLVSRYHCSVLLIPSRMLIRGL